MSGGNDRNHRNRVRESQPGTLDIREFAKVMAIVYFECGAPENADDLDAFIERARIRTNRAAENSEHRLLRALPEAFPIICEEMRDLYRRRDHHTPMDNRTIEQFINVLKDVPNNE